jgi:hypothetical protein
MKQIGFCRRTAERLDHTKFASQPPPGLVKVYRTLQIQPELRRCACSLP